MFYAYIFTLYLYTTMLVILARCFATLPRLPRLWQPQPAVAGEGAVSVVLLKITYSGNGRGKSLASETLGVCVVRVLG